MKTKIDDKIQIIAHAIMSNSQCTHQATLEKFIIITKTLKIYPTFLYQERNNQARKANETVAWSEGKLASGICSRIGFIMLSGLLISTTCCINRLTIIAMIIEKNIFNKSDFFQLSLIL